MNVYALALAMLYGFQLKNERPAHHRQHASLGVCRSLAAVHIRRATHRSLPRPRPSACNTSRTTELHPTPSGSRIPAPEAENGRTPVSLVRVNPCPSVVKNGSGL